MTRAKRRNDVPHDDEQGHGEQAREQQSHAASTYQLGVVE
jgi:hypothetical protein